MTNRRLRKELPPIDGDSLPDVRPKRTATVKTEPPILGPDDPGLIDFATKSEMEKALGRRFSRLYAQASDLAGDEPVNVKHLRDVAKDNDDYTLALQGANVKGRRLFDTLFDRYQVWYEKRTTPPTEEQKTRRKQLGKMLSNVNKQYVGCVYREAEKRNPEILSQCVVNYDDPEEKYERYSLTPRAQLREVAYLKEIDQGHHRRAGVLKPSSVKHLPTALRDYLESSVDDYHGYEKELKAMRKYLTQVRENHHKELASNRSIKRRISSNSSIADLESSMAAVAHSPPRLRAPNPKRPQFRKSAGVKKVAITTVVSRPLSKWQMDLTMIPVERYSTTKKRRAFHRAVQITKEKVGSFLPPPPHGQQFYYLFNIIDVFSKYALSFVIDNKEAIVIAAILDYIFGKAVDIPDKAVEFFISRYGRNFIDDPVFFEAYPQVYKVADGHYKLRMAPTLFLSDNGSEFVNDYVGRVLLRHSVTQLTTFPYKPLGIIERFNKTLKSKMEGVGWQITKLDEVVEEYNTTRHSTTRYAPIEVHFSAITGLKGQLIVAEVYRRLLEINRKTNPVPETLYHEGDKVKLHAGNRFYFIVHQVLRDVIGGHPIVRYILRTPAGVIARQQTSNGTYVPLKYYHHQLIPVAQAVA